MTRRGGGRNSGGNRGIKAAGIQPVALGEDGVLYFLLGRERGEPGWRDTGKWAQFAGKREAGESVLECAVREGYEESMGFLGRRWDIRRGIAKRGAGKVEQTGMRTYLYWIDYDPDLPARYADVFDYMSGCECPHGWMEKSELRWFPVDELAQMVLQKDPTIRYTLSSVFERMLRVLRGKL